MTEDHRPLTEADARTLTLDHANRTLPDLSADREWQATSFDGGWLLIPIGDDLRWQTGVPWFIVLDDRTVHETSSSLGPPERLVEQWARGGPLNPGPG